MTRPRPVGVDLFAGAGGLSLGFEQAGFDVVAAVEYDPVHAAVHSFNFPHCDVLATSVRDLTGAEIRAKTRLGNRKVQVVFGGAPCQGFSLIGQRALDDPRNALVRDFVRIVTELDADYFVFENVKGITLGPHVQFLRELVETFQANGYSVRLPWAVLNATSYGVPQNRERLFLLGAKKGLPIPSYPQAISRAAGSPAKVNALPEGPSCRDALGDIPDAELVPGLEWSDAVRVKWGKPSPYAMALRGLTNDANGSGYGRIWDPELLTSSARTGHTEVSRRRFAATTEGEVEPISRFFKLPGGGVSNTLRAGSDSSRGAFTSPRPIHYEHPRCVTVREMARLHGFPDWFRFHVTKWHGARQIGNAVPPPLARAVASAIVEAAGYVIAKPVDALPLGNPALLSMDMANSSAHFGVAAPIGGRDRKAAPKRRQWDDQALAAAE
jgi:DNA (cytosine-5)-methyltransferase 1